jgi:hypothetical protein
MWKPEHRVAGDRRGLRYPSDLIDAEWNYEWNYGDRITVTGAYFPFLSSRGRRLNREIRTCHRN